MAKDDQKLEDNKTEKIEKAKSFSHCNVSYDNVDDDEDNINYDECDGCE